MFITYTNETYSRGAIALLKSLSARSGIKDLSVEVIINGDLTPDTKSRILDACPRVTLIRKDDLGRFELNRNARIKQSNLVVSLQKLVIFLLPGSHRYYIDADMICMGNLSGLDTFRSFSAPIVFGISLPGSVHGRPMFSGGSFIFDPDPDRFRELQEFASFMTGTIALADQTVLNEYFYSLHPEEVHLMGMEWEMLKRVWKYHPAIWRENFPRAKFIHFCGIDKPWDSKRTEYHLLNQQWRDAYGLQIPR